MKYKVKVTVIDKKLYPELQQQYCADPASGACQCYNVGDEFIFSGMMSGMISGIWDLTHWLKQKLILILWQVDLKCRIVLRHGMQSRDISMRDYRVALL